MQRLALLAAALAAPSMSRNASRGPMRHRPVRAGESAPPGGNTTPTTPAAPPKTDPPTDQPRSFSQEELDRIIAREKGKLSKDAEALRAKLAEYEARDAEAAEKAKGAEGQAAAEARAKREMEKLTKERDAATAATTAAETRYRNSLLDAATSRALVGLEFVGADAAELVEARVRGMLKVEQEGDGAAARDVVYLVDGKDEIAVTDREKLGAWLRKRFPSQLKAASGAGAPHGGGKGASADMKNLTPGQKIASGLT